MTSFWEQGPLGGAATGTGLQVSVLLLSHLCLPWCPARTGFHSVLLDTEDVIAFPVHQPQAFWGRAAWGKVDVGTLCGTCAPFPRGDKQHSFSLESISSK